MPEIQKDMFPKVTKRKLVWDKALWILDQLKEWYTDSWMFCRPIEDMWPYLAYRKRIKYPMDLGTVEQRILGKKYKTVREYARDVRATFENCIAFNEMPSLYNKAARAMLKKFNSLFKCVDWRNPGASPERLTITELSWVKALKILEKLMAANIYYNSPVTQMWPYLEKSYEKAIRTPMDLGTVKARVVEGYYSSLLEFEADVKLTYTNALCYNSRDSPYFQIARTMLTRFSKLVKATIAKESPSSTTPINSLKKKGEKSPWRVVQEFGMQEEPEYVPHKEKPVEQTIDVEKMVNVLESFVSLDQKDIKAVSSVIKERYPDLIEKGGDLDLDHLCALDREKLLILQKLMEDWRMRARKTPELDEEESYTVRKDAEAQKPVVAESVLDVHVTEITDLLHSYISSGPGEDSEANFREIIAVIKERHPELVKDWNRADFVIDLDLLDNETLLTLYRLGMDWLKSFDKHDAEACVDTLHEEDDDGDEISSILSVAKETEGHPKASDQVDEDASSILFKETASNQVDENASSILYKETGHGEKASDQETSTIRDDSSRVMLKISGVDTKDTTICIQSPLVLIVF